MTEPATQLVLRLPRAALDDTNFELGLVRLTPDERFGYLNRAAREIVGRDVQEGDTVHLIALAEDSRKTLQDAMDDRFHGGSATTASYTLEVQRGSAEPDKLVRVTTIPEFDEAGTLVGSVGLVVDGVIERAELELHRQIQHLTDDAALYGAIDRVLHQVVDFDALLIVEISGKRNHVRILFEEPMPQGRPEKARWTPMRPFVRPLVDDFAPGELDLAEFVTTPEFLRYRAEDPNAEFFAQRGFLHSLRLGVHKFGELVAMVSLLRRADVAFTPAELGRCTRLPYETAVNAAIAMEEAEDARFASDLIDELARIGGGTTGIGRLLVSRLATYFEFDHVALMRVESARRKVRLIVQAGPSALPADFRQDFGDGLLGRCMDTGLPVNEGDVARTGDYIEGIPGTRSELVIPLFGRSGASCVEEAPTVNWLLNIESSQLQAFADEEQTHAMSVLGVAAAVLDRAAALEVKTALSNSVADAILQTDDLGIITYANPAAERLFGRPFDASPGPACGHRDAPAPGAAPQLRLAAIETCLDRPEDDEDAGIEIDVDGAPGQPQRSEAASSQGPFMQKLFEQSGGFRSQPATALCTGEEARRRVLVSGATLEGDLGGRIFVVTDISQRALLARYGEIRKGLTQLGSEIRAPLTLAQAFIVDMLDSRDPSEAALLMAREQLRKAMLPLEGLMRIESATAREPLRSEEVELDAVIERLGRQLPADSGNVARIVRRGNSPVKAMGARNELQFCIEAVLAHVLRHKALVERLDVVYGSNASSAIVRIAARSVDGGPESRERSKVQPEAGNDDFLARPVVEGLLSRMGGVLRPLPSGFGYRLVLRAKE